MSSTTAVEANRRSCTRTHNQVVRLLLYRFGQKEKKINFWVNAEWALGKKEGRKSNVRVNRLNGGDL